MNTWMSRRYETQRAASRQAPVPEEPPERLRAAEEALSRLNVDGDDRTYFQKHLPRLAHTLALIPESKSGGAILELGSYMQITPFLMSFCGYSSVRGAHFGPPGKTEIKVARVGGRRTEIPLDTFDAERDRFPYEDSSFEAVLACEIIEHLIRDPMHMLLECRRVLAEGGRLLVTTPNTTSLTSVGRALHGYDNPQVYAKYPVPKPDEDEIPHVREYTAFEVQDALESAGFEIERLLTGPIAGVAEDLRIPENLRIRDFLEEHGYNTSMRGEQTYCIAIKRSSLPVTRYPRFLYDVD